MKVYVITDGYDYEGGAVVGVFSSKAKAWAHLKAWRDDYMEGYGYDELVRLPFGFKFGSHYLVATEMAVDEERGARE